MPGVLPIVVALHLRNQIPPLPLRHPRRPRLRPLLQMIVRRNHAILHTRPLHSQPAESTGPANPGSTTARGVGVLPPLPLGESWGAGGGRRGPRDLAQARPPSYAKVSTGEPERGPGRGVLPPLPLGEGWGEGGGRRGPRDLAEARPPSYAKVSTGEPERAGAGVLPPLPLGEGWGEGGGRRGPRDPAKTHHPHAHRPLPPSPLWRPLQRELYTCVPTRPLSPASRRPARRTPSQIASESPYTRSHRSSSCRQVCGRAWE